ncbi:MAG: YitT family protein [Bacilli bacterium]|nr:YitT family protein [Bacilli bacterium]
MSKKQTFRKKFEDILLDHPVQRAILTNGWAFLVIAFSAFLFAFGFRAFLAPANLDQLFNSGHMRLVTGGVSGISQVIIAFVEWVFGDPITKNNLYDIIYSILYFGINVPIFILAWRGIGKRFAIFTLINVGLASAFTALLRYADPDFFFKISEFVDNNGGLVTRALLGGICTGVSSAIAFKVDASAGGMDVVAYYIALKKSRLVGRYSVYINVVTVTLYTLITISDVGWGTEKAAQVFVATLFSVLYLFVSMFMIDTINLRNKKVKIEAVSEMSDLGKILVGALPHGATMLYGEGAYTSNKKYIFTMVVSSYEAKQTVRVIQEADPNAFVDVFELQSVAGRFFLPPIR